MSLPTPDSSVEKLQKALQAKAKSVADCRFYTLWDKVCRWDVLVEAYRRCRANGGATGVDNQSFAAIESDGGVETWLMALRETPGGTTSFHSRPCDLRTEYGSVSLSTQVHYAAVVNGSKKLNLVG